MVIRLLMALTVVSLIWCAPARAEEPKAVAGEIAAARKSKDDAATSAAVKKAADAYNATEDKAAKSALLGELGKVIKDKKMSEARLAAVATLVEIGDSKPCWKQLSRFMPNPKKTETASDLQLAVIAAAGSLASPSAIKPLTELAYKAKDNKAAGAAAFALGGYGKDKKSRVRLLVELIDIGLRTRPGRSTTKAVSPEAQQRWQVVGQGVVGGLNRLTGAEHSSFEEWESIFKDNKKKPGVLFNDDD